MHAPACICDVAQARQRLIDARQFLEAAELLDAPDVVATNAIHAAIAASDIRAKLVERAGVEDVVAEETARLLAEAAGQRLAELRKTRGFTQQEIAGRMGVTKGRVSQIERGQISGQEVLVRYAAALGGQLHQAIYFDDGDIAAIA